MDNLSIIEGSLVPGWARVFIVGSYDERITFFSQQVRAMNLATALFESKHLAGKERFAVVGAGAAGISLATSLALLFQDAQVDVFEGQQDAFYLQRGSHRRNVHPHIYDWPDPLAGNATAGLPILDWQSNTAHEVALQVMQQFEFACVKLRPRLKLTTLREVFRVDRAGHAFRVHHKSTRGGADTDSADYDAVFLTIGFGIEKAIAGIPSRSYWSDAGVPDEPKVGQDTTMLISGSGDGGLIDLAAAAVRDFDHSRLIKLITGFPSIDEVTAALAAIDQQARLQGPDFDYLAAYDAQVSQWATDSGLLGVVVGALRQRVALIFNTTGPLLFGHGAATLNRLAAYLVVKAMASENRPIMHSVGRLGRDPAFPVGRYLIGAGTVDADIIVVRHGPDVAKAFEPFSELRQAYEPAHLNWLAFDPGRRLPPTLTHDAQTRLTQAAERAELPILRPAVAAMAVAAPARVRIEGVTGSQEVIWEGPLSAADLVQWWDAGVQQPLIVACASPPEKLGSLSTAIARLAIHGRQVSIETDQPSWGNWLDALTKQSMHTRALEPPIVRPLGARANPTSRQLMDALASVLHQSLDQWMLAQVDAHLTTFLQTGREPSNRIGWPIEPNFRPLLLQRWRAWHLSLAQSPNRLARTLRLATCAVEDAVGKVEDRVVLSGPYRLAQVLRAFTQALAVSEALPITAPREGAPGNFEQRHADGREAATIHASSTELILGDHVSICADKFAWSTTYTLLSELGTPLEIEREASKSLMESTATQTLLSDAPPSPNVIIGADRQFLTALGQGVVAVVGHVRAAEAQVQGRLNAQLDLGGQ